MISKEFSSRSRRLFIVFFAISIFLPKISLIEIPGYWQGIRFEELIVLLFIYVIFKKKTALNFDYIGKSFFIFFLYFMFSSFIGYLHGIDTNIILYLRYIEYLVLLLIINTIKLDVKFIVNLFKGLIVFNLILSFLQLQEIIGVISSKGYFSSAPFGVPYGIFGGSWELSVCSALSYFIVANFSNDKFSRYIFLIPVLIIIYLSENKGGSIAFIIAATLLLMQKDKKLTIAILFIAIILIIISLNETTSQNFESPQNMSNSIEPDFMNKLFTSTLINLEFKFIFNSLYNLFVYKKPILLNEIPNWDYLSLKFRIDLWLPMYDDYLKNYFTIFFGKGFGPDIYIESFIIRLIFSFGIIGSMIVIYFIRHLPFYLVTYIFLAGITLDLFISMKIFIFTSLLIYSHNRNT